MTGGEMLPVTAAAKIAKSVAGESEGDKGALRAAAEHTHEMKLAGEAYAKRLAIKQAILLKLYAPLARLVGVRGDYFETKFSEELAERIADIPEEDVRSPRPAIAAPAMQALSFSLDEEDLKEMYLNLLASAVDGRRSEPHPAFAEVIRQLSPDEAAVLITTIRARNAPICQIRAVGEGISGYIEVCRHLVGYVDSETGDHAPADEEQVWVDNWIRLGLVTVDYSVHLTNAAAYDWVDDHPEFRRWKDVEEPGGLEYKVVRGCMSATSFGQRFAAAVSRQPSPAGGPTDPAPETGSAGAA